jgi:hypothetical protein
MPNEPRTVVGFGITDARVSSDEEFEQKGLRFSSKIHW